MSLAGSSVIAELVVSLVNIQASRYTCGAAMTVMFYDFALTAGDEFKYIWSRSQRMSVVKLMFIWNRYMTMPWILLSNYHLAALRPAVSNRLLGPSSQCISQNAHLLNSCQFTIPAIAIAQGISIVIGIQLLALRVLALYKNDRKIRIGLYSWLAACHITLFTLAGISMSRFIPFLRFLPLTNSCYTIPETLIGYVYIPPLLAESSIFILQIVNHLQRRRTDNNFRSTLLSTLYRDGYLYFVAVMGIRLMGTLLYGFGPSSLWFISNQMDFSISTALISRFFLQLRGALSQDEDATVIMPLSRRGMGVNGAAKQSQHAGGQSSHSMSLGIAIQSVPDLVTAEETYLHLQQLRRIRAPR